MSLKHLVLVLFYEHMFFNIPLPFYLVITFIVYALIDGSRFMFFGKVGKPRWHAFIPLLSNYTLYDISWRGVYGIIDFVCFSLCFLMMPDDMFFFRYGIQGVLAFIFFLIHLFIRSIYCFKTSYSFNKNFVYTFGIFFFEPYFLIALARDGSEYLGRTLLKYNPHYEKKEKPKRSSSDLSNNNHHLVNLYRRRSVLALQSGIVVFILTYYAVIGSVIEMIRLNEPVADLFKMFTTNANTLSAIGAAFMIPYAIEGIRKKRFTYPKWVSLFQYSGAICTSLTMAFTFIFIWPVIGPGFAFGGNNFFLHIICPIFALVLLFSCETMARFNLFDVFISCMPFFVYGILYVLNVMVLGTWPDVYRVQMLPVMITVPSMFMMCLGIAFLIRVIYNRIVDKRHETLISELRKCEDNNEILIELYGLGLLNGIHDEINGIILPFDIFHDINEYSSIPIAKLSAAFVEGVKEGQKERKLRLTALNNRIRRIFGTPEKLKQA